MSKNMPERMLRLLSLLQSRREWGGLELAERMEVTTRTVRRDIDRLRALGYPVEATTGSGGGYRLASGRNLPPLLLDDEEAVAIAIGLRSAMDGTVAGIEEAVVRAIAKLDQVFPERLRRQVSAFATSSGAFRGRAGPRVDVVALTSLAAASRNHERISFGYRDRLGAETERRVEPHGLVTSHGRWTLVGYDLDRSDWRTFRVDRLARVVGTGRIFAPRELPAANAGDFVARSIVTAPYRYRAEVLITASPDDVTGLLFAPMPGRIEPVDDTHCKVALSTDSLTLMVQQLALLAVLDFPQQVTTSEEVREAVAALSVRLGEIVGEAS